MLRCSLYREVVLPGFLRGFVLPVLVWVPASRAARRGLLRGSFVSSLDLDLGIERARSLHRLQDGDQVFWGDVDGVQVRDDICDCCFFFDKM